MRSIIVLLLTFLHITLSAQSLSNSQRWYVRDYFSKSGNALIMSAAHMTCDAESIRIYFSDNDPAFTFRINYSDFFGQRFHCDYQFKVIADLIVFMSYECNSPDEYRCFSACNENLDLVKKMIEQYRKNNPASLNKDNDEVMESIERLLGMAVKNMNCQDFCKGFLMLDWIDQNYYRNF